MIDRFDGEYRFLSNFYSSPVKLDGVTYPTVEHAYQAAKTHDDSQRKHIRMAITANEAKRRGRKVKLRDDWDNIKLSVMEKLLRQKFSMPGLQRKLKYTGTQELIEGNWWGDTFWGVCDGKGENHLGKLLMKIRQEQRAS